MLGAAGCVNGILAIFCRRLWSVTEQIHGNMVSFVFFFYDKKVKFFVVTAFTYPSYNIT